MIGSVDVNRLANTIVVPKFYGMNVLFEIEANAAPDQTDPRQGPRADYQ